MKQNNSNLRPELPGCKNNSKKENQYMWKIDKAHNKNGGWFGCVFKTLLRPHTLTLIIGFPLILQESQNILEEEIQNNYHQKSPKIDCTNLIQYLQQQRRRIPLFGFNHRTPQQERETDPEPEEAKP